MENKLKEEYASVQSRLESLVKVFNLLQQADSILQKRYNQNPDDIKLVKEILNHERKYDDTYEKIETLNFEAKALKEKLDLI